MRMLFEPDTSEIPDNFANIHNCQALWRLRERVSIEDLSQKVFQLATPSKNNLSEKRLIVLNEFLKQV